MSKTTPIKRTTITNIRARKGGIPIICLTAYTAPMTALLDPHVDLLLVGDSLGMVVHGHQTTLNVTLAEMILHARSVMRAKPKSLVVVDLPFGTYEESPQQAHKTCVRVMQETGADAVKLEGGVVHADTIAFLTERGIPVMAHIGLQPQAVMSTGGYRIVGRNDEQWQQTFDDAKAVEAAGAFAVVIEGVVEDLAAEITQTLSIPTIGIGASAQCDGQILVTEDMLGLFERTPKFVRKFAALNEVISEAIADYANSVTNRSFPSVAEIYDTGNRPAKESGDEDNNVTAIKR